MQSSAAHCAILYSLAGQGAPPASSKKAPAILRDSNHTAACDAEHCTACGQPVRRAPAYGSVTGTSNRIGLAVSVALHLLVVLYYLTRAQPARPVPPPPRGGEMVYIAPLATPVPAKPAPRPKVAEARPLPTQAPARASIAPPRRKQEVYVPPVVSPLAPVQEEDMEARIAAARKRRAQAQPQPEPEESEQERGLRIARANIAGAQGRNGGSGGGERNDSGGIFSIVDQTSHSAEIKFRGWNGNFKRNWLKQERVEQGAELDIETAIVKMMIELIRKEKPGDFIWDSQRLGRHVNLSARVEDTAELQAFLLKEFFPGYRRGR